MVGETNSTAIPDATRYSPIGKDPMSFVGRSAVVLLASTLLLPLTVSSARGEQSAEEAAAPAFENKNSLVGGAFDTVGGAALHLGRDLHEQLTYPFALASRDPYRFMMGTAGILALIVSDRATFTPMSQPTLLPEGTLVGPAQTLSSIGSTRNALPLVLAFGAVGLATGSGREKQTSIMLAEALVTSGLWTSAIKYVAGRERPREMHEAVADWTGPGGMLGEDGNGGGHASFPSGHATGIWATATVLAHQYPTHHIVPTLAYGSAVAISYSRMVVNAHFLSDIVVGGLIGYGCARQVIGSHDRDNEPSRLQLLYEPSGDQQRVGLSLAF